MTDLASDRFRGKFIAQDQPTAPSAAPGAAGWKTARRGLAVLRDMRRGESLADHYVKRFRHLVPKGVEIWELDQDTGANRSVYVGS